MSGRYVRLGPGRYNLEVSGGAGPAGIRRREDGDVHLGIDGGSVDFEVGGTEEVYYWWRGPRERPGVRLRGGTTEGDPGGAGKEDRWPAGIRG